MALAQRAFWVFAAKTEVADQALPASGDGHGGSRTRGVVTAVYVHWRPIEPCRRDVQRAEAEVLDATAKLGKAVPAAAAAGAEEMQPVLANAALNLADARLTAARAALHN